MYRGLFNRYRGVASATITLLVINVVVMIAVIMTAFVTRISGNEYNVAVNLLDVPGGVDALTKPWTLVTYMFTQTDVMHCIFNMLWLYWFGTMYEMSTSGRRLVAVYLVGGIVGAVVYTLVACLHPAVTLLRPLEGASASVMAVVGAMTAKDPRAPINLLILGRVKLVWVSVITLVVFATGIAGGGVGANIAHIAGFGTGMLYQFISSRWHMAARQQTKTIVSEQDARARLDELLDKARRSGYSSLSRTEQSELVELSRKV